MKITYYQHEIEVPDWANWIACDKYHDFFAFELEPVLRRSGWGVRGNSRKQHIGMLEINVHWEDSLTQIEGEYIEPEQLTMRDQFAMAAMQGELASQSTDEGYYSEPSFKRLAENSYKIADAMMEARAR